MDVKFFMKLGEFVEVDVLMDMYYDSEGESASRSLLSHSEHTLLLSG